MNGFTDSRISEKQSVSQGIIYVAIIPRDHPIFIRDGRSALDTPSSIIRSSYSRGFYRETGWPGYALSREPDERDRGSGWYDREARPLRVSEIQIAYYSSCHANKKLSPRRAQSLPRSLFGLIRLDTRHLIAKVNA